jgi:hypothetical protein
MGGKDLNFQVVYRGGILSITARAVGILPAAKRVRWRVLVRPDV